MTETKKYSLDAWQQFAAEVAPAMEKHGLKNVLLIGFTGEGDAVQLRNIVVSFDNDATAQQNFLNKLSDDLDKYFRASGCYEVG